MKEELIDKLKERLPHLSSEEIEQAAQALYQLSIITYKIIRNGTE
ncbi:MAG TPA: hypothetical protein VL021_04205 [Brumimicrobium sp.]|nr:hypothetical protein [Brumimicrobium sp.]